jgi:hypothetical protein
MFPRNQRIEPDPQKSQFTDSRFRIILVNRIGKYFSSSGREPRLTRSQKKALCFSQFLKAW